MAKEKKSNINLHPDTQAVYAGLKADPQTGAVMTIYATSTYEHKSPGEHSGYEYSRTQNPTREVLENALAELEDGKKLLPLLQA